MASQAFRIPRLKVASLPPAMARSVEPARTIQKAWPMAWPEEEQAVEMVKLGPVMPNSMEMWLAPALAMVLGMVSGCTRLWPSLYNSRKPMSSVLWPPTQDPVMMAAVSRSSGVQETPASATASRAAITANCAKRSMKSARRSSKYG
jgi:hypothetical protein